MMNAPKPLELICTRRLCKKLLIWWNVKISRHTHALGHAKTALEYHETSVEELEHLHSIVG